METIFVSVASYRDSSCSKTLDSMYSNATNPERVHVGICEQNKDNSLTEKCTGDSVSKYLCNIKTINLDYTEAKGPTWARYLCSTLYDGQDYFMQVDSHVLFVKDWDTKCIRMMNDIKSTTDSNKPLLSHYTKDNADYESDGPNSDVTRMCQTFFNKRGMLSFLGSHALPIKKDEYHKNPFIAAGFIFVDGSFVKDVPFDPTLDYVFVGEEILLSARAYTSGYDTYGPSENICYHYYTRSDDPKIWTDKFYNDEEAHSRIMATMKLSSGPQDASRYGLGTLRTLEDFYEFAGVDLENKKIIKNFCVGEIDPYNELEEFKVGVPRMKFVFFIILVLLLLILLGYFIWGNRYKKTSQSRIPFKTKS